MKHLPTLLRHELKQIWVSPATYLAAVLTLLLMGFLYFFTILGVTTDPQEATPSEIYFSAFWLPVLLVVPLLTMKSFAEERRQRTLETLMTTPVTAGEVVMAKFLAAWLFYLAIWAGSLLFPVIASRVIGQPEATALLLDQGPLTGGFLFVALSGMLFVAVGIFSSSLTRSQLVAGMLSFSVVFILLVGAGALRYLDPGQNQDALATRLFEYLQIFDHFEDFVRGVIDTRPFIYYLSSTALVLGVSSLVVESKA